VRLFGRNSLSTGKAIPLGDARNTAANDLGYQTINEYKTKQNEYDDLQEASRMFDFFHNYPQ
jgi:hypothetical protein